MKAKTGVLLINLGTPTEPTVGAVRKFLREFLSDPRVLDLPWILRQLILNCIILPFRSKKTAKLYQKIWSVCGSPILYHSQLFKNKLAALLGEEYHVVLGMRYGKPALNDAVNEIKSCAKIVIFPLFPQYSEAASGSAIVAAKKSLMRAKIKTEPLICYDFFRNHAYQTALSHGIKKSIQSFNPDFLLFSYHSLPERHLTSCDKKHCDRESSCLQQAPNIDHCYRAQCFFTTEAIAEKLALTFPYATVFQSRLGRVKWIGPPLDKTLEKLAERGIKRLLIVCPSFVADCLETLEEINLRARLQWQSLGGEAFQLVPCLNADPEWVCAASTVIQSLAVLE